MTIRPAIVADLPALMNLVQQVVPLMRAAGNFQWDDQYPNTAVFGDDIRKEQLWVAVVNEQVAGVIAVTEEPESAYEQVDMDLSQRALTIHQLAVDPLFRGQGIAAALMAQAEQVALERNIAFIRTDTNSENRITQNLFPKMGYRYAGELTLDFRPGLRFLAYEKQLEE